MWEARRTPAIRPRTKRRSGTSQTIATRHVDRDRQSKARRTPGARRATYSPRLIHSFAREPTAALTPETSPSAAISARSRTTIGDDAPISSTTPKAATGHAAIPASSIQRIIEREQGQPEQQEWFAHSTRRRPVCRLHHVVMVVPVDADVDEGEQIGGEQRQHRVYRRERRLLRELELEHHDRDDDGDDAVGKRIQAASHPAAPSKSCVPPKFGFMSSPRVSVPRP